MNRKTTKSEGCLLGVAGSPYKEQKHPEATYQNHFGWSKEISGWQ